FAFEPRKRRLRLFDGFARAIPGAPYAVEIDGSEVARGLADAQGDITLPGARASVCTVRWNSPIAARPELGALDEDSSTEEDGVFLPDWEFDYTRDIFIDLDEPMHGAAAETQEAARKRLSNMG